MYHFKSLYSGIYIDLHQQVMFMIDITIYVNIHFLPLSNNQWPLLSFLFMNKKKTSKHGDKVVFVKVYHEHFSWKWLILNLFPMIEKYRIYSSLSIHLNSTPFHHINIFFFSYNSRSVNLIRISVPKQTLKIIFYYHAIMCEKNWAGDLAHPKSLCK